ncbi:hypothetical protein Ga0074812_11533 [Parafrankia irregularis]|uniref:Uncharacterized protein n=1 Tax=Parafrankia irregularis TaxID=795642 RepID=A0A0S4QQH9_9ACTN|nr:MULTISPECIES: hypothetical protein [Parafrankia]MBE3202647.1 hypothetical protein [Parafrankia sp. CH37]CUU57831.1 hypothetical protein Ga0074812_11533 [Parafrankia irregularis]
MTADMSKLSARKLHAVVDDAAAALEANPDDQAARTRGTDAATELLARRDARHERERQRRNT